MFIDEGRRRMVVELQNMPVCNLLIFNEQLDVVLRIVLTLGH